MKRVIYITLCVFLFASCNKENGEPTPQKPIVISLDAPQKTKVQQDNDFAFDFLQRSVNAFDDANVVLSPISVSLALGMVWNGADGDTKTKMETALKMSGLSVEQINEYYKLMQTSLPRIDPKTKLSIANSIWYKNGFQVYRDFLETNKEYFNSEVAALDFTNPQAVKTINDWCAKNTNNLIPKVLDYIPGDAVMYLINAIYFKGTWSTQFDKERTFETNFYNEDNTTNLVKMMSVTESFNYTEDESAQYLELPYGSGFFNMTFILPKGEKTTTDIIDNINISKWNDIQNQMYSQEVVVRIPRFKTKLQYLLNDVLQAMGMTSAFGDFANFSKISMEDIFISRVLHDTYIEVTEEGTEAAAVTTVEMVEFASEEPQNVVFFANKPFLFLIHEKSTGIILFIGKIGNVEKF